MTLKMKTHQRCLNFLDCRRVRYAHITHSPAYSAREVAQNENLVQHLVQTVVLKGDGYVFAVVPPDSAVNLREMRLATGVNQLQVASVAELFQLFPNADIGAVPPLGPLFHVSVFLDRQIAEQEFIAFWAGTHRDVIQMRAPDFISLVDAVIGDFARAACPQTALAS